MRNAFWFAVAAFGELAGCYAIWLWIRRGRSAWLVLAGLVLLAMFAYALTRTDLSLAGRAFAAYGGVYIFGSLLWLRFVDAMPLRATDLLGAGLALLGTVVIVIGARS